jgi:hypothetical protein
MNVIPQNRKLIDLVNAGYNGEIRLPQFQRSFVWDSGAIRDLIQSVFCQYYIGSLLILGCDPQRPPFHPVKLRGAAEDSFGHPVKELVLDGQQRLTSLLYALYAPALSLKNSKNGRQFFVDVELLLSDRTDEGLILDLRTGEVKKRGLAEASAQHSQGLMPMSVVRDMGVTLGWLDGYRQHLLSVGSSQDDAFQTYNQIQLALMEFHNFQVPVISLPQVSDENPDDVGAVCTIFEKINSTGEDLSVYDLLTARLYRDDIDLHKLWSASIEQHHGLNRWSEGKAENHKFGVLALRTVALLRNLDPKPRILINLEPKNFEADWQTATSAIECAIKRMSDITSDGFGVFSERWIPNYGLIPVLAALLALNESLDSAGKAQHLAEIRRWYWCSLFLERYSSSVESLSRKDFVEFSALWMKRDENPQTPEVFRLAQATIGGSGFSVEDSASTASSVYCGVFALLAIGGAKDWKLKDSITLQNLEDHHIFPKSILKSYGIEGTKANTILNRTLIADETNQLIKARRPADYVVDRSIIAADSLLVPHFISPDSLAAMKGAHKDLDKAGMDSAFRAFKDARSSAILARIREVCGVATDSPTAPK